MNKRAFFLGILVGAVAMRLFLVVGVTKEDTHSHTDDVHVHADFLMILGEEQVDLTVDKYQSGLETGIKHNDIHLHDNQGNIIHRHAEAVTFGDLLTSIGFTITPSCIETDEGEQYCIDTKNALMLYVNGFPRENITSYIIDDEDQVLLYYGPQDNPRLQSYLASISDEACIYSGTCPERGTPPPEACGLTCEVAPEDLDY